MGWFWGNSGQKDPTKQLDPELREYLEKESPARYTPTDAVGSSQPTTGAESQARKSVPAESLFPDGRYAHLWKNYKPLAETEDLSQQQSEMVIQKVKQRKDAVHQAALENCALEHEALTKCFSKGDWWSVAKSRATICAEENRKFSRCYTTQAVGSLDNLCRGCMLIITEIPTSTWICCSVRMGRGARRANSNACRQTLSPDAGL